MERILEWLGGEDAIGRALAVGTLLAARIAPVAILAPWLSTRGAPVVVRAAIVLALTVALAPVAMATAPALPEALPDIALLSLRELVVGATFAVATALPFHALDWAGRLVDTWRGASMAEVIAPPTGERTSPLGDLQLLLGVSVFCAIGGHRVALDAFATGLADLPVGAPAVAGDAGVVALGAARLFADAVAFALALATPAAVAIVAVEVALGLVARAAPQIPVFFAGMPLRAAVGLGASLLALSLLVDEMPSAFAAGIDAGLDLIIGP